MDDAAFMDRALFLAGRARGLTTPNPLVGAVVVTPDGIVAGAGFHECAGGPHAEVVALRDAGPAARGATLYCTLEPCNHVGRTPPCVDGILEAGITRVVAAVGDPNAQVRGGGFRRLRDAGVRVDVGEGEEAARRINRPFFSAVRRGRPYVVVKAVTSLDGRIAASAGVRTALSSAAANRRSQLLRAEVDAIAVGSGTLLVDDPLLTARDVYRARPLTRVIFDRRLRVQPSARVFATADAGPVIVATSAAAMERERARVRDLEAAGATLLPVPDDLGGALTCLAPGGIHSLLVEGGPALHAALWRAGLVDALWLVVTPRALGPAGVPWVNRSQVPWSSLRRISVRPCGDDVCIEADVHWTD